jgi:peptidoglycan/xylan/chitin deacetylase (PgdA/CDA1 family)
MHSTNHTLVPGTTAVLLYHRMGRPKLSSLVAGQYVVPSLLSAQIDCLKRRGWIPTSLAEAASQFDGANRFAVTFDDGYLSVYESAYPVLKAKGVSATLFIVAETVGGLNEWDRRAGDQTEKMMTADQIREMASAGFEIGSHTLSHPFLTELSDDALRLELADSRKKLEDIIGQQVVSFSYPYGDLDRRVSDAAADAGYRYAATTKLGVVTESANPFEIPRINVRWNTVSYLLMRKINRARRASGLTV